MISHHTLSGSVQDFIFNNLEAYGPLAVFGLLMLTGIGVPLGEDLIVIPAGMFVAAGKMSFLSVFAATWAGVVLSDCMWYMWCYVFGTRLLHVRVFKRLVHPRRLLEAKYQIDERGAWVVVMARFIPGSRTTAITVSGMLHMPFWKFALATGAAVMVTAPMQIGLGVLFARVTGAREPAELIRTLMGLMVTLITLSIVHGIYRRHRASRRRAPRAKASWLRRFRTPPAQRPGDDR